MAGSLARRRAWTAVLLAALVAGAVVAVLAARGRQSAQADADQRELQAYRLTMAKVRQMNEAYSAYFKGLMNDPRFQALQKAREELSALEHKEDLTAEDERRIAELEAQIDRSENPAALEIGEQQSLSEMVAAIESQPGFVTAIRAANLTPREFAKIQLALFQAMFAYGFLKTGTIKELPPAVPEENVAFVKAHEQELMEMAKQWEAVAGGARDAASAEEALDDEAADGVEDEEPGEEP